MAVARWKVYDGDLCPTCTHCGMGAPYARYKRGNGLNGRELTDYCPTCGAKITAMDECKDCSFSDNGEWQDNGICFACRGDTWLPHKKQNERILKQ